MFVSFFFFQILVQVKDVLSKLPSMVEITLKEVRFWNSTQSAQLLFFVFD